MSRRRPPQRNNGYVKEEPLDEEPLDEEPLDEEPLDEEPLDEEPLDEEPLDEEPLDEEPVYEEPEYLAPVSKERKVLPPQIVEEIIEYEYVIEEYIKIKGEQPTKQKKTPKPEVEEESSTEEVDEIVKKPIIKKRRPASRNEKPTKVRKDPPKKPQPIAKKPQPVQKKQPITIIKPKETKPKETAPQPNDGGGDLLFNIDSDEEYSDDDLEADEDNIEEVMEKEKEEEEDQPQTKAPAKYERKPKTVVKVKMNLSDLSAHKTGCQYMCPRFDIEKFNPRTKLKIMSRKRVWEVNFCDQKFANMRRKDFLIKKELSFNKLWKIKNIEEKGAYLIELHFRNDHPYRLKCGSKKEMLKFYELGKLASPNSIVWIPELMGKTDKTKKIELKGQVHYECNRKGQMVVERKELMGTSFLVDGRFDELLTCCMTWNLENQALPTEHSHCRKFLKDGADIYAISLQGVTLKKPEYYTQYFKTFFESNDVHLVNSTIHGNVLVCIFVHKMHGRKVHSVKFVKKTLSSKIGGLPAVIVKFCLNESPIAFVGAILPGHEKNHQIRRQCLEEIFDSSLDFFHHIYLMGDLQYVISLPHSICSRYVKKRRRELLEFDQLRLQMKEGVLCGFREGNLSAFSPTFPCTRAKGYGGRQYIKTKMICYAGRVLVKSYPGLETEIIEYSADHDITTSSHCPVYSFMRMKTQRIHVSHFAPPTKKRTIQFTEIYVGGHLGTALKEPQLEFQGGCLEISPVRTKKVKSKPTSNPRFCKKAIPELIPCKMELEFISSEFIFVSLVDDGNNGQVIGTGVVALEAASKSNREVKFKTPLVLGSTFKAYLMGWIVIV